MSAAAVLLLDVFGTIKTFFFGSRARVCIFQQHPAPGASLFHSRRSNGVVVVFGVFGGGL